MKICTIDPLTDRRWAQFVATHEGSSIFHTAGWLRALQRSYDYQPLALAAVDLAGNLTDALVFCRVKSWLTGTRLVSLPFSDHCEPLVHNEESLAELAAQAFDLARSNRCKYIELRPSSQLGFVPPQFRKGEEFYLHVLDLRPGATDVFRCFHRDCVQRKIRRAEKEQLRIAQDTSPQLLEEFYRLLLRTRRRHGLPPQPIAWFRNLVDCLEDRLFIRLAYKEEVAIAGIVTLQHRNTIMYKYGVSDERFHKLGGMPYLLWHAIQDATGRGIEHMDMGRSETSNSGLVSFKEHWGAKRIPLTYWTTRPHDQQSTSADNAGLRFMRWACACTPDPCLSAVGSLMYRHVG